MNLAMPAIICHFRESGNPEPKDSGGRLGSRFRGAFAGVTVPVAKTRAIFG